MTSERSYRCRTYFVQQKAGKTCRENWIADPEIPCRPLRLEPVKFSKVGVCVKQTCFRDGRVRHLKRVSSGGGRGGGGRGCVLRCQFRWKYIKVFRVVRSRLAPDVIGAVLTTFDAHLRVPAPQRPRPRPLWTARGGVHDILAVVGEFFCGFWRILSYHVGGIGGVRTRSCHG